MATNVYASPEPRTVKIYDIAEGSSPSIQWLYHFKTKVKATDVTDLGQEPAATLSADGKYIVATDLPRPFKARHPVKKVSSFCSADKVQSARNAGWGITRAQFSVERAQETSTFNANDRGSVIVSVPTVCRPGGSEKIDYAWYLPKKVIAKATLTDIQALGIKFPASAAEWKSLVLGGGGGSGSNTRGPRPPRASKTITASDGTTDTVTTFYEAGTTLPADWVHVEDAIPFIG